MHPCLKTLAEEEEVGPAVVLLAAENQQFLELKPPEAEEEEVRVTSGAAVVEEVDEEAVDLEGEGEEIVVVLEEDKGILKHVCKGQRFIELVYKKCGGIHYTKERCIPRRRFVFYLNIYDC